MVRTQVYLTEHEKKALAALSSSSGKKQSELIRDAIDSFIAKFESDNRDEIFERVSGMWADRDSNMTAENLRSTWDRSC